ncbi:MAG: CotH kinase family protein [Bacteroidota bacterium]
MRFLYFLAASLPALLAVSPALSQSAALGPVAINEVLSSNITTLDDPDFRASGDWVELYNGSSEPVDLTGYTLTDDLEQPSRWTFPAGSSLAPESFLLVWADGRDTAPPEARALHTSFRLSSGEDVALFAPDGSLADSLRLPESVADVSLGRQPDGTGAFAFFSVPTPGAPNAGDAVSGILSAPVVSPISGLYDSSVSLETGFVEAGAAVRYTLDGTEPTPESPELPASLVLDETAVVRLAAFAPGQLQSEVVTRTFLIGETSTLPVVSLVTDPDGLFSNDQGIYVRGTNGRRGYCASGPRNWNQDWERPVHLSFFEPDGAGGFSLALDQGAGVKIFGGCSRLYPQKSLVLHARSRYGAEAFAHQVFPDLELDQFDDLVLRSSAQDWWRSMFRDGMIQTLTRGMGLDGQAYRPALLFLNGEYWGIHNLREKLNEDYVAGRYGLDDDEVTVLDSDNGTFRGKSDHYDGLLAILDAGNLNDPGVFAEIEARMDVDQYLNYQIVQIYSANADWPGNNQKLWRERSDTGRWRWMLFDLDFGFGGNGQGQSSSNTLALATAPNGPEWPNPPWSTYLFRRLLENDGFRHTFIQRLAAHTHTTFDRNRTHSVIDSLRANIAAEIPRHKQRWRQSTSFSPTWDAAIDIMRKFAIDRPKQIRSHVASYFDEVAGSARLTIDAGPGGQIYAETVRLTPHSAGSTGSTGSTVAPVFYRGVPVRLVAVPDPGYQFAGWSGVAQSVSDTLSLVLTESTDLTASFAVFTDTEAPPAPADFSLSVYPNPAAGSATIETTLTEATPVTLRLFDVLGREIRRLADDTLPAGPHRLRIDLAELPSGLYLIVAESAGHQHTQSLIVLP